MFEKVNPNHPDKLCDRIAGALVDIAYTLDENPRIAVEVLLGHGVCRIICETSVKLPVEKVHSAVCRIAGDVELEYREVGQDTLLAENQKDHIRCGDNGIFKGVPLTTEQIELCNIAQDLYDIYESDGKYILDGNRLIICQSNADSNEIKAMYPNAEVNPLGDWTGGIDVDTGATNRKLGSDLGDSITGGGVNGKDMSKADVSVSIYAWLKAQAENKTIEISCAIGDEVVDGKPYAEIVKIARDFIRMLGGFEKLAEWGIVR